MFSAAHFLEGAGKCEAVHGHNYRVEVCISARTLHPPGMVADFVEIRERLDSILPDHRSLNECYDFSPTAENLARHFFEEMSRHYPVTRVSVWENDQSRADYAPD